MKNLILPCAILLSLSFRLIAIKSCNKSINNVSSNKVKGEGQFSFHGVNYVADSTFSISSDNSIRMYKDFSSPTDNKLINIILTNLSPTKYTISAIGPNTFVYTYGTTVQAVALSGSVTISSNTGRKISGLFSVQMQGRDQEMKGTFSDIEIRQ